MTEKKGGVYANPISYCGEYSYLSFHYLYLSRGQIYVTPSPISYLD